MGSRYELFKIAEEIKNLIDVNDNPQVKLQEKVSDLRDENKALKDEIDTLKVGLSKAAEENVNGDVNNGKNDLEKQSNWELDDFSLGSRSDNLSNSRSKDPLFDYLLSKQRK